MTDRMVSRRVLVGYEKPICGGASLGDSPSHLASGYFFPAAGYRNNSSGALNNVTTNGYYWAAVPNSATNGRNLNFNSSNVNPLNNNNRANGNCVRPVQEFAALLIEERFSNERRFRSSRDRSARKRP